LRAFAALALSVFCIAWSAPLVRWADVPGVTSAFYRALVAAVVLVPYWLLSRRGKLPSARATIIALLGGAFFAMDLALFNTAVLKTSATTAMVLTNNSPILVGLGTWLLFRERPKLTFWIGQTMEFVACAMVLFNWHADIGVILLIVFTVVASLLLLRFWEVDVPPMRVGMQNGMVANIAVVGGLLLLLQNVR